MTSCSGKEQISDSQMLRLGVGKVSLVQSKTKEFLYGGGAVLHSDYRDDYINLHVIKLCTFSTAHTSTYKTHINKNAYKNW